MRTGPKRATHEGMVRSDSTTNQVTEQGNNAPGLDGGTQSSLLGIVLFIKEPGSIMGGQQGEDAGLFFGVEDAVDHPALLAGREGGFVLEEEAQVFARLAGPVARREIVANDAGEHEAVGAGAE